MKICFVLTTRGNYGKLKTLIELFRSDSDFDVQIIANDEAFIEPDFKLRFFVSGGNHEAIGHTAALACEQFALAFTNLKPDAVVLVGDRYETLAAAFMANCMNIPVVHLEGGEKSGTIDETFRHAITKLSHMHFACTWKAAQRIRHMGEQYAYNVGATSLDIIEQHKTEPSPYKEPYLLVIYHPVATAREDTPVFNRAVYSFLMNTIWIDSNYDANCQFIKHYTHGSIPIEKFVPILNHASCIIGNSSTGVREASYLGIPSVNVGSRQNGREKVSNVLDVGYDYDAIVSVINGQLSHGRYKPDFTYGDGTASQQIYQILKNTNLNIQK